MGGARSSAFALLLLLLAWNFNKINAETYDVGAEHGWSNDISMEAWAKAETFYDGDFLVFKYDNKLSDVVVTDKEGFLSCKVTPKSIIYRFGNDKIMLPFGHSYFISGYLEQCQGGMKMDIYAKNRSPL